MLLSMGIKLAVTAVLGAPPAAVPLFEVLLNVTSMFNHGNVRLPPRLEGVLRSILVTPEMHRVHHSVAPSETNSNYGFNLAWWDRLLDRKSTRLNSSHTVISYAVFCLKKKNKNK